MKKSIFLVLGLVILVGLSACSLAPSQEPEEQDLDLVNGSETEVIESGEAGLDTTLNDNPWLWLESQVNDEVITPNQADAFVLTFDAEEGRLSAQTDCNNQSGPYTLTDESLTVGPMISTLMYCEGSQENVFAGQLAEVNSYDLDEDNNLILNFGEEGGYMLFAPLDVVPE